MVIIEIPLRDLISLDPKNNSERVILKETGTLVAYQHVAQAADYFPKRLLDSTSEIGESNYTIS